MIGKLHRVSLREVWPHEAYDFTTWLQDNLDELNNVLGVSLSSAEREQTAGAFSVDLVAEDESGNPFIIENQLEKSDHDHLGKVVTYLAALGAKAAIWIVSEPRPEHTGAISWLNESSSADFYLVKVEAVRIGDSPPAPLLTLIVGPSTESRVGDTKKELAERHRIRKQFWEELLNRARSNTDLHNNISPNTSTKLSTSAGRSGLYYEYRIRQHDARVDFAIYRDEAEENEKILNALLAHRGQIEENFGGPLGWRRLEGQRGCRVDKELDVGGYHDEELWPEIQKAMIDTMVRLEQAIDPYVKSISW